MKKILNWALRRWGSRRILLLENSLRTILVQNNALEAECRCYRIRLGWEMPGMYIAQGHWVWHSTDGTKKPFPGTRWEHILPPEIQRIKGYME
jgi:hypothetical protein